MSIDGAFAGLQVDPDWQDVLVRSATISRRGKRQFITTAAVVAVLAAIAGPALATSGWLDSIFPGTPVSTDALSGKELQALQTLKTRGAPTPLSEIGMPSGRLAALKSSGLTGIRRLGDTQGLVFYAFDFQGGGHCYDAVRQDTGRIVGGILSCARSANGSAFPSREKPIIDLSLVGADLGQPMHTIQLEGVAADGVAAVGVLGADGTVYGKTDVVGNVFVSKSLPPEAVGPTIAYAASGRTVWCFPYTPRDFPTSILRAAGCPNFDQATGRWVGQPAAPTGEAGG